MAKPSNHLDSIVLQSALYGVALFVICFLLANLEIQIEGPNGWASALPTWRIVDPNITWIFGGRPVTGYHLYLNLLLLCFFHFPLLFGSFTWDKETKALSGFTITAVFWDFLWFVMNPYFGLQKYGPAHVWWFKNWAIGFPIDYYFGVIMSLFIFLASRIHKKGYARCGLLEWIIMFAALSFLTGVLVIIY